MGQRSYRSIGVRCRGQAALFEGVLSDPGPGQILVQTLATGLSAGTELSLLKGTDPHHRVGFDPELRVFDALAPTAGYPIPAMGYMEVARVAQSRADGFATGQVVAMAYGHRTAHVADPGQETVVAVPSGLDPLLGVYVAQMGPICANALLHATAEFAGPDGDALGAGVRDRHVLITGAGAVGLLTALFARQHGAADVAVADPTPRRLQAARALGLTAVDDTQVDPWQWAKRRWVHAPGDRGADVVFQCRGRSRYLATALRCLRPGGAVVDLAFYQDGAADLCLGQEFHHNGLTIRCAQISRLPRGLDRRWDRRRLAAETIALLAQAGDDIRAHLITDLVPFDAGPAFLHELADRRRHTIQAVFTPD